jgi:hypothetical protein
MHVISIVLLLPALLFVSANLLKYSVGVPWPYDALAPIGRPVPNLTGDAIVLLGPLLAAALIGLRTVRVSVVRNVGTVTASLTVAPSRTAVLIVGLSVVILGVMGVYLVAENLPCIAGQRVSC